MNSRKGITPVIAVVLLLMITVALIGFAFIWFQGVWESVSDSTGKNIEDEVNKMTQTIKIDNIDITNRVVYIRATGSNSIPKPEVSVYVNNVKAACYWLGTTGANATSIAAKGVEGCVPVDATFNVMAVAGETIKATSPGTSQGDVTTAPTA